MHIELYKTADMNLATTMIAFNQVLEDVEQLSPTKRVFVFNETSELEQLISDFWHQKLMINPQKIFDALKCVKSRIHHSVGGK